MNNLLFTALAIALIYYFFYRPTLKNNAHRPLKANQETQTSLAVDEKEVQTETIELIDPKKDEQIKVLEKDIQQKEITIIGLNNSYEKLETKKNEEIKAMKKQMEELKIAQQAEEKEWESKLDELIQQIKQFNQEEFLN